MYLICLLSRVGSITVNNLNVSKDGHGILMYFAGMGLTQLERFQGWSWHSHVFCWDGIDTLGPSEIPKWVSLLLIFAELDGFYTHCYSAVTGQNSSR